MPFPFITPVANDTLETLQQGGIPRQHHGSALYLLCHPGISADKVASHHKCLGFPICGPEPAITHVLGMSPMLGVTGGGSAGVLAVTRVPSSTSTGSSRGPAMIMIG